MTILIAILIIVVLFVGASFNMLVSRRNSARNSLSTIDVMLKKRFDLIPNLVETVKAYSEHEKHIFESIAKTRSEFMRGDLSASERVRIGLAATGDVGRLLALSEAYPELKASSLFLNLQKNLSEIEEQISASRRAFNSAATDYNNACEMLPTNMVANLFGFSAIELFSTSDSSNPAVSFKADPK